jgi:hypothetical protein
MEFLWVVLATSFPAGMLAGGLTAWYLTRERFREQAMEWARQWERDRGGRDG